MASRTLDYPVFDVDNHYYESTDAFTKYLPKGYENVIKYVEVDGRTKMAVKGRITNFIPNPTFNVVSPPGAYETLYMLKNPASRLSASSRLEMVSSGEDPADLEPPPKYIRAVPAYFDPEPRMTLLDELGIDRTMMWPTIGAGMVEARLEDDPNAMHVVMHAFNQWLHEHWTFDYEDRIFAPPVISLAIVDRAVEELEWVLERGAKAIQIRVAPVPGYDGRRSMALPEFDPFWSRVENAGIVVGTHAGDSGYARFTNEWDGGDLEARPFETASAFSSVMATEHRATVDLVTSVICHGLVTRFPRLKLIPVENGSAWVRPLITRLERAYDRDPEMFDEDPVEAFKRNIFVHPFHEEDTMGLVSLLGVDNVVFGSDYPHPEGLRVPLTFVNQLSGMNNEDQAKVMGGNLARLMGVAA
jgi:predicted TIM-barrel fold metal-dependent hydrolase